MPTDADILTAFYSQVAAFASANSISTIAWDGEDVETDGVSAWLEILHMPNNYSYTIGDDSDIKQGMFQINIATRRGAGNIKLRSQIAEAAKIYWPRLSAIGGVIVTDKPYTMSTRNSDTAAKLPLTINYHQ